MAGEDKPNYFHRFLKTELRSKHLGAQNSPPKGIIVVSAHFEASPIRITSNSRHHVVHDIPNFRNYHSLQYNPPGDPELAKRIQQLLKARESLESKLIDEKPLDHGCWGPLLYSFPEAELPVVEVSLNSNYKIDTHLALGRALSPLVEEGYLLLASGQTVHNRQDEGFIPLAAESKSPSTGWPQEFADWVHETLTTADGSIFLIPRLQLRF
jgi:4,5-DOPA dioxygenase extradiol